MKIKTIERWGNRTTNEFEIVFENYLCGFPPIILDKTRVFGIIKVFVTIEKTSPNCIKMIEAYPWSKGEIFKNPKNLIPSEIQKELSEFILIDFLPKLETLMQHQYEIK